MLSSQIGHNGRLQMNWTILLLTFLSLSSFAHASRIDRAVFGELHPTQFTKGQIQVDYKQAKMSLLSDKELAAKIESHPVEIVIAPNGKKYVVDGHHFLLAAHGVGVDEFCVEVLKDYSQESFTMAEFWDDMIRREWVHLYRLGVGPLSPEDLPDSLEDLVDDVYRSISHFIRKAGGFSKANRRFLEHLWADFFREFLRVELQIKSFESWLEAAMALAQSPLAAELPGYLGRGLPCDFNLAGFVVLVQK